jgi:hypothetical protein
MCPASGGQIDRTHPSRYTAAAAAGVSSDMTAHRDSLELSIVLVLVLTACGSACDSTTGPTPAGPLLRVINVGSRHVEGLVVLFPNERVEFGNVAVGVTTPYRVAASGVFRYAAYEFVVDGQVRTQPVIDWVGERPMEGQAFTYSIEFGEGPSSTLPIRLVGTRRDY